MVLKVQAFRSRRSTRWAVITALAMVVGGPTTTLAQGGQAPFEGVWRASWIAPPGSGSDAGVYLFRRDLALGEQPASFVVKVSADNRYRLLVNGMNVAEGPARGDVMNWRYETVDLAPYLKSGRNSVAAIVWNFGEVKPAAQASVRTGFLLQGEGKAAGLLDTGPEWRVLDDRAYTFARVDPPDSGGYYVAGPRETFDAAAHPWGWETASLDDGRWKPANVLGRAFDRGRSLFGIAGEWQMVPRSIPPMEHRKERFAKVRRAAGAVVPSGFVSGSRELIVPPNATASILIDMGKVTMGHPAFLSNGGKGAEATITYAEALVDAEGNKGNRDEVDGKRIIGLKDVVRFDGGTARTFSPLWLRSFRYMQVDVRTGEEPLRISDLHNDFSAYPLQQKASFKSDASWIGSVWDIDWHALRLSAYETYWDTPYYEQLQYVGDTRIEALLSVYQAGDDRLMRNAIELIDASRTPEGLTLSRYPSEPPQLIPSFSLWWVAMVHDYWMLRDDPAFARRFLPGVRSTIAWYEQHVDGSGMVGPTPWWSFLDWAKEYKFGVPPGAATGHATAFTLQLAVVARQAAELEDALGRPEEAQRDRALAARLVQGARAHAWDPQRGLFKDAPEEAVFSEQTNALALLADAVPDPDRKRVMNTILSDSSLIQASFYFRFYVDEALRKSGLADRYLDRLAPWRSMIANGMTSTAETPEPTRSDSHAWSAHPNYHLLATVLGIRPSTPGFRSVSIEPALGRLKRAAGTMPHERGEIAIDLRRIGRTGISGLIDLPASVSGDFSWEGSKIGLHPGANVVRCEEACRVKPSTRRRGSPIAAGEQTQDQLEGS